MVIHGMTLKRKNHANEQWETGRYTVTGYVRPALLAHRSATPGMSDTPPTTAEQADAQAKVERVLKRLLAFARSPGRLDVGGTCQGRNDVW